MNNTTPPPPINFFSNLEFEHCYKEMPVLGELPESLNGVLFRNGAGIFEQFGRRYKHTFECDGAINALKIENSKAFAAVKIIKSAGLKKELAQNKNLYGSKAIWPLRLLNNLRGNQKNVANTHVIPWQKKLFALMEGGKPTELDKESLTTIGETDFNGVISGTFSAHPHYVSKRNALYNFGMEYGKETILNFYELPDNSQAKKIGSVVLEKPVMLHDFIVTNNHLVFFISPLCLNIPKFLFAIGSFVDALEWRQELGTEIIIVPIDEPDNTQRFKTESFLSTHFGGAYEENGQIIVDYIHYADDKVFTNLGDGSELDWSNSDNHPHGSLHRAKINLSEQTFFSESRRDGFCEFPRIDEDVSGQKYSYLWLQSEEFIDNIFRAGISKIDDKNEVKTYLLEKGQLCSEPVPIIKKNTQDDGYIITLVFDSNINKSHYLVLTARDLKFQAKIELEQTIPITFHGSWVEN